MKVGINMVINSIAVTNVGRIRDNNEDNYFLCGYYKENTETTNCSCINEEQAESYLFSVCDGMGGTQFGELASLIAVKTLIKYENDFDNAYSEYITEANDLICDEIYAHDGKRIGTTFTALSICNDIARAYNIGDSRIYLLRNAELSQLSVDHTQAQLLVRQGIITAEQAKTHKDRNVLTQHFGIFPDEMVIEPYVAEPIKIMKDDVFLLCSDGLTDMVPEDSVCSILSSSDDLNKIADELIKQALENGGRDNVTVLIVKAIEESNDKDKFYKIEQLLKSKLKSPNMSYLVEEIMQGIRENRK